MNRRVRITAPDRLLQSRQEIIFILPSVVKGNLRLHSFAHQSNGYFFPHRDIFRNEPQSIQRHPGVAVAQLRDHIESLRFAGDLIFFQTPFPVLQRTIEDFPQNPRIEPVKFIERAHPAEHRVIDGKIGVFRSASDKADDPLLQSLQQRILLKFIPAVKLVDIDIRRLILQPVKAEFRIFQNLFQLLCSGDRSVEFTELRVHL